LNLNLNFGQLAGSLRGLWDELVERRLWPVALVLVAALVALPVVLSKQAAEAPPAAPAPAAPSGASPLSLFQPAVSTDGRKSSEIRKDLRRFKEKNPFTPKAGAPVSSSSAGTATVPGVATTGGGTTSTATGTGSNVSSGSGIVPGGSSGTSTGSTGNTTDSARVSYFTYTVDVRFGKVGQPDAKTLTRFRALPSSEDPIVVFMGVRDDGKTAVFLVSAAATTTGEGTCQPSDDQCTFLYMTKGDKRAIEAVGQDNQVVDYQLEMRDVNVKKASRPHKAKSSRSKRRAHKSRARARSKRTAHKSRARTRFKRSVRSIERLGF
jgi:hypothetical protein